MTDEEKLQMLKQIVGEGYPESILSTYLTCLLYTSYTTDLRQRKIGDHCKELHIATRWSVHDIIGRLEREYIDSDRAKFIVIPALDENDESNFDYAYGVGFSTKFYHEQRNIMDDVSWRALYLNQPIEREGLVYSEEELRRYFELPKEEPDAIIGICDTKDKGTDYAFLPVAYVYGQDYYIDDCVCDNGLPNIVDARLTEILAVSYTHLDVYKRQPYKLSKWHLLSQGFFLQKSQVGRFSHNADQFSPYHPQRHQM